MPVRHFKRRIFFAIFFFVIGISTWIALNGHKISEIRDHDIPSFDNLGSKSTLVEVAGTPIVSEDLEWEYNLHVSGMFQVDEVTPIPDLGSGLEKELSPLKQRLLAGIIERKILFKYLQRDRKFDIEDPARYTACLSEWQSTLETDPDRFKAESEKVRLKNRLCERSIVLQYLEARIFPSITITETQISEYYKNNLPEFRTPPKATVRQIVLADEPSAKKVKRELTRANFAELAEKYSITPEGQENGGIVGPFAKGDVPAVFDVSFQMSPGQISQILKSTYGFHIIMLVEKKARKELSLKEASPKIKARLESQRKDEEYRKWLDAALNSIPVTSPRS